MFRFSLACAAILVFSQFLAYLYSTNSTALADLPLLDSNPMQFNSNYSCYFMLRRTVIYLAPIRTDFQLSRDWLDENEQINKISKALAKLSKKKHTDFFVYAEKNDFIHRQNLKILVPDQSPTNLNQKWPILEKKKLENRGFFKKFCMFFLTQFGKSFRNLVYLLIFI